MIGYFVFTSLAVDNKYTKAMHIRRWAKQDAALLTPALKWVIGQVD
jgi:hypothetical protein